MTIEIQDPTDATLAVLAALTRITPPKVPPCCQPDECPQHKTAAAMNRPRRWAKRS